MLLRLITPAVLTCLLFSSTSLAQESFDVTIGVDSTKPSGELRPIWRFFGGDEPNYVYMKDGRKLTSRLGELRKDDVYFRTHNLLTSGDGTPALKWGSTNAYTEDEWGKPVYDWTIVDRIFDTQVKRGVKPYVQVGFMPEAMSTKPKPYQHEWRPGFRYEEIMTGWRYPPKSYEKWGELVYQWAKHCKERYGEDEVLRWYWQTWNEANICPDGYWGGTPEEFYKLHDYTVAAIRRAIPNARVGGPDTAGDGGDFTRKFLEHCLRGKNHATGKVGTPIDFVSFHAKGSPRYVDDHIQMGIADQLRTIDRGFGIVASFPELKQTPIVIGESDPEGCAACQGPQFSYRNGTMYSSYTAASFARKHDLADKHGVRLEGALTWAFEFEDQPYFAGFRQLASNGIPLAVFNVFRMMSQMESERLPATSSHQVALDKIMGSGVRDQPDVGVLASRNNDRVTVLVWHYHDDDLPGPVAKVKLEIRDLGLDWDTATAKHYRVDETHGNPFGEWKRMGSPGAPNEQQYKRLMESSELTPYSGDDNYEFVVNDAKFEFDLPRQGVSLIELTRGE
ncbi:GH39 family glycosyl hydrolase [Aeoliella sp. SH292]|uniref:GH39 family glycosyl hydrolase n=1 Tax=Aeoliella sp. SH292 TaxID=3454464 RepID=UPI003F948E79